jgi:Immunity protein 27
MVTQDQLLKPGETRLQGRWVEVDGSVQADDVSRRIDWLVDEHLVRIAEGSGGWSTLLRDPTDDRFWELTYPSSERHGGGPPTLLVVTRLEAEHRYQVTFPDTL